MISDNTEMKGKRFLKNIFQTRNYYIFYKILFCFFRYLNIFLRIFISGAFVIYILEIKSKKNAALNKPNTVSSVHENNNGRCSPSYATDGIIQRGVSNFFHSSFEISPWIRIDLQDVSTILFLRVYMRDGAGIQLFINTCIKLITLTFYTWFQTHYCQLKVTIVFFF